MVSGWIIEKLGTVSSITIHVGDVHIITITKFDKRTGVQSRYSNYHNSLHSGFKKVVNGIPAGEHGLKIIAMIGGKQYSIFSKILTILPQLNRKFIFVHVLKASGTSLRKSVEEVSEKENIFLDYNRIFHNGTFVRNCKNGILSFSTNKITSGIIFGHLLPCKYCDLKLDGFHKRKNYVYITFLRDPLQRAISHYYFWKKFSKDDNPMLKISRENCSFEEFLTYEYFTNIYSKMFFGFPVENFDFIGITENFSSSMNALSKIYGEFSKMHTHQINTNNEKSINDLYEVDKNIELKFRELNKKDYKIYEKAKKINLKLINSYNL